uniref:Uncharacterized protein n=1 Tax=Timema cristinae TaxID=61476 RepID=A0A7R9CP19_TIMCR|nr:unnamed protein product [Timema cristinae]
MSAFLFFHERMASGTMTANGFVPGMIPSQPSALPEQTQPLAQNNQERVEEAPNNDLQVQQLQEARLVAENNNEGPPPVNNNVPPHPRGDEGQEVGPQPAMEATETLVGQGADRPTLLSLTWTFFTSFFASLIPEQPGALYGDVGDAAIFGPLAKRVSSPIRTSIYHGEARGNKQTEQKKSATE